MAKRQLTIAGTDGEKDAQLEQLARQYRGTMKKRVKLLAKEVAEKDGLITYMREKKIAAYRDTEAVPPFLVTLKKAKPGKDNVEVEDLGEEIETEEGAESDDEVN